MAKAMTVANISKERGKTYDSSVLIKNQEFNFGDVGSNSLTVVDVAADGSGCGYRRKTDNAETPQEGEAKHTIQSHPQSTP